MEQLSLFAETTEKPKEPVKPKRNINPQVWAVINGQPIPYSFRQLVINVCRTTATDPARIFFRAEESGSKEPMKWIWAGMKGKDKYAFLPCAAEDSGGAFISWKNAYWVKTNKDADSVKQILRNIVK